MRERGERIEEKMRKKKTKKMGDDAAASDEAGRKAVGRGSRRVAVRSWILALISLVRLDCKSESVCRTEIDREFNKLKEKIYLYKAKTEEKTLKHKSSIRV